MNKSGKPFNTDDEGILQLISSMAASGIENAQLREPFPVAAGDHSTAWPSRPNTATSRTRRYLRHISEYSALSARPGLPEREVENIRYASPLHDIGKVGIADAILLKPGKLTAEEFEEIKKHTLYGAKILCNAESSLLQIACKVASSHHEKFDGTGYPNRLKAEQISIYARIVSVADVFDALCSQRVYKPKWDPGKAREYINGEKGKAFDPSVVEAFEKVYGEILKMRAMGDGKTTVIPGITKELHRHF